MSQAARAQEPSMEEILASIRRIIADDETKPEAAEAPPRPAPVRPAPVQAVAAAEPETMSQDQVDAMLDAAEAAEAGAGSASADGEVDVLELTEAMEARPELPPATFDADEPTSDVVFADPMEPEPQPMPEPLPMSEPPRGPSLLSEHTTAAVTTAFGSLAHTVLLQNARTLDDLVRDMLRPMLKTWLDDNLPTIVERLVRAEIERVSRGRS